MKFFINLYIICLLFCHSNIKCQIGIFSIEGNLTLGSTTNTEVEIINGSGPGTGHDQISVNGNLSIAGTLNLSTNGYFPNPTQQFEIYTFTNTLIGNFATINWPPSLVNWSIDYGIKVPGKITIYGPSSPLPVNLISFEVYSTEEGNELKWQTASEVNAAFFLIETSIDGKNFVEIAKVDAKGNSNIIQKYKYLHREILDGLIYYRLKQIDIDGSTFYSEIINIESNKELGLSFFPNPSNGILQFNYNVEKIEIFDFNGKSVLQDNNIGKSINIGFLPTGIYFVKLNNTNSTKEIVINK